MPASCDNEGLSIFSSGDVKELCLTDSLRVSLVKQGLVAVNRPVFIPQWKVNTPFNVDEEVQNFKDHLHQTMLPAVRIFAYLGVVELTM